MPDYTIGRLRGGFAVSWHEDGRRRRFQLAARSRKEAEAEAIDIIRRETVKPGGVTVEAIWNAYREEKEGRPIAEAMKYGKAVLEHFGHYRPDQITKALCVTYSEKRRGQGVKVGTVWTELGWLRTALLWGAAPSRGMIPHAPDIERPQKPAPRNRWLTREEIRRLIDAAASPHIALAIILMVTTAARVGAILDLTWDRVDFERRRINLRTGGEGPTKGRAIVPMNSLAEQALRKAKEGALSDYVIEWAGERVGSIRKGFQTACAAAGLTDVTPHTIRHCAARFMVEAGIPMDQVAQYLGHSNPSITFRVYGRFSPEALRTAGDVLSDI